MFKAAGEPWANSMRADAIPTYDVEWGPRNQFKNFWGYEKLMMDDAAKYMNFTYSIGNPPDRLWGSITETGQWNGFVLELVLGEVDFTISSNLVSYLREQVSDSTTTFAGDYIVMATPRPSYQ